MTDFERDLRRTLKRREPPRDLTAAIMARVETSPRRAHWLKGFYWREALAAAAVVVMVVAGGERYREYKRAEDAKQQLILALRITGQKLAVVQAKVDELNRRSIGHDR